MAIIQHRHHSQEQHHNMEQVFELLRLADWMGESEAIEIAKGKNELPTTLRKGVTQIRRQWQILTK